MFIPSFSIESISVVALNAFIVFLSIVISDKFLNHNITVKNSAIMVVIAYLIMPYVMIAIDMLISIPSIVSFILVPLIIWIILGEMLLKDFKFTSKLNVSMIAFITYLLLEYFPISYTIVSMIL